MTPIEALPLSRAPVAAPLSASRPTDRERVGEILVRMGALDSGSTAAVIAHQAGTGQLFGEAAVTLRLVDSAAVARALAEQARVVPTAQVLGRLSTELVVVHDPFGREAERVRDLRTRLLLESAADVRRGRGRVIAILSPAAGEGRSWLAANLAACFAQRERRTVLVDADLRSPRQHQLFGVDDRGGLVGALSAGFDEPVPEAVPAVSHLDLLCAGSRPANPQELLSQEAFGRMVHALAAASDTVILDTPAAGRFSDPLFAAAVADTVLLLARRDRSRMAAVRDLAARLSALDRPVAGVVFNER